MADSISQGLRHIKSDLGQLLSPQRIHRICRDCGYQWRDRVLDPVTTIHGFVLQILHGNLACTAVRHLVGRSFTPSAYCQARMRLPLNVLQQLMRHVAGQLLDGSEGVGLWHGHRTFLMDGSSFSMPDTTPLRRRFRYPGNQKPGCGFPTAHMLTLFDAATGFLIDVTAAPWPTGDLRLAHLFHGWLKAGDLLVGDRGLCSFVHLCLLSLQHCHAVFRVQQAMAVDFTPRRPHCNPRRNNQVRGIPRSKWLKRLGRDDQLVLWHRPRQCPPWMANEAFNRLPNELTVRELRYRLRRRGSRTRSITLVTTLLDPVQYPKKELIELYKHRWQVETNLRHLKQTMGLDVLHCQTVEGVHKELTAFAIVYNAVRAVMLQAARSQQAEPDRISFVDVLRWIQRGSPGHTFPQFVVNPHRTGRVEPRTVKRRPKPFPLMTKPRSQLRNSLLTQHVGLN